MDNIDMATMRFLQQDNERLQAECAAMREALEKIRQRESSCDGDTRYCSPAGIIAHDILSDNTTGAQLLERYKAMERVVDAAKKWRRGMIDHAHPGRTLDEQREWQRKQVSRAYSLRDAVDALEETP